MTAGDAALRVDAFLESYRQAFERYDANAIAQHFAFPCHIASDSSDVSLASVADRQEWIARLEQLLTMYRAIDVGSASILERMVTELSVHLCQAVVHWALADGGGRSLYEFEAAYTLVQTDGGLRIAAIAHNELPRYRTCLARLRAGM
jgi:hypothetical protein